MADRVEAGVPEQDATPPTPRVARDGVEPAFQKQDREELERQGRARLSLGQRKLPERLWERRLGREPGLLEEVSQVLHHVPATKIKSCCCQKGKRGGKRKEEKREISLYPRLVRAATE